MTKLETNSCKLCLINAIFYVIYSSRFNTLVWVQLYNDLCLSINITTIGNNLIYSYYNQFATSIPIPGNTLDWTNKNNNKLVFHYMEN